MIDENYWIAPWWGSGSTHTVIDDGPPQRGSRLDGLRSGSAAARRAYAREENAESAYSSHIGFAIPGRDA